MWNLVIRDPLEPDVLEFKFYASGVGMIKEIDSESDEKVELIDMTTPWFTRVSIDKYKRLSDS